MGRLADGNGKPREGNIVKRILVEALRRERLEQPTEGDSFGTQRLLDLADETTRVAAKWKANGKPVEQRWILAALVEACRAGLEQGKTLLHPAGDTAPSGLDEARQEWLAALEAVREAEELL